MPSRRLRYSTRRRTLTRFSRRPASSSLEASGTAGRTGSRELIRAVRPSGNGGSRRQPALGPAEVGNSLRGKVPVVGVAQDTVLKGLPFGQIFSTFSLSKGEPSGSSCVASARSRGRGYFFFSQVSGMVVRVVDAIIFPERVAEHEQFTHDGNHAGLAAGLTGPQAGIERQLLRVIT